MSVENLTKYGLSELGSGISTGQFSAMMVPQSDGDFVKFEEAVDASSNSLQQLKDEISKVLSQSEPYHMYNGETGYRLAKLQYEKLLKLSAV